MGVTIFDLFGEIFNEHDMINFLKENGIDPNGFIGGGLAIRCFLLLKERIRHRGLYLTVVNLWFTRAYCPWLTRRPLGSCTKGSSNVSC